MFASLAKLDHILFKVKGYKSVFEHKNFDVTCSTDCRFGLWYGDIGKKLFSTTPSYSKIDGPHETVHRSIKEALTCVENGTCLDDINFVISKFQASENASLELFTLLNSMLEEAKNK
ncbi:CZB domain-containing protein [Sulfurospirillum arcachonense]|uniref:CZB domain-containing protein n=1 Tax=Sulfurospirillum arcachonense TaxID=57666 RepID=UPI001FDF956F